jgi:hypothetical protein
MVDLNTIMSIITLNKNVKTPQLQTGIITINLSKKQNPTTGSFEKEI